MSTSWREAADRAKTSQALLVPGPAAHDRQAATHDGALATTIKWSSISFLLVGCALTVGAYVFAALHGMPDWLDVVKTDLEFHELKSLGRLAEDKAVFATEVLSRVQSDLDAIHTVAQDAIHSPAPAAGQAGASFPGLSVQMGSIAGDTKERAHSVYFTPGRASLSDAYTHSMNAHTKTLLDKIAPLDTAFRSLRSHYGESGTLLYIGLEDPPDPSTADGFDSPAAEAVYKIYPGENMDGYADWGPKWCDARWTPAIGSTPDSWPTRSAPREAEHPGIQRQANYYDPRCRSWYQDARAANGTIFTAPYTDASTEKLVMTAAAPIYLDTSRQRLAGVVAIDFSVDDLDESILDTSILGDGYAYVMADDGLTVIHKLLDRDEGAQSVAQVEGFFSDALGRGEDPEVSFEQAEASMKLGCKETTTYTSREVYQGDTRHKDGGTWYLSFHPERAVGDSEMECTASWSAKGGGYIVALTVSEESILRRVFELQTTIKRDLLLSVIAVSIIVAALAFGMAVVAARIAQQTVTPIRTLREMTKRLNDRMAGGDDEEHTLGEDVKMLTSESVDEMLEGKANSPELEQLMEVRVNDLYIVLYEF